MIAQSMILDELTKHLSSTKSQNTSPVIWAWLVLHVELLSMRYLIEMSLSIISIDELLYWRLLYLQHFVFWCQSFYDIHDSWFGFENEGLLANLTILLISVFGNSFVLNFCYLVFSHILLFGTSNLKKVTQILTQRLNIESMTFSYF